MREWICRFMEESFRGRGLGTVVTQETIDFFDGLVNFVALVVTQKAEFRPAARWTNSWIYSSKCGGPPRPPETAPDYGWRYFITYSPTTSLGSRIVASA